MTTQTPPRVTMRAQVNRHHITSSAEWIAERPDHTPAERAEEWNRSASHYRVTLRRYAPGERRTMTVYYSMGAAHTQEPTTADVLSSLAMDAAGVENARGSFEAWAGEYGYDTDSRKVERTWRATLAQADRFSRFCGPVLYDLLLWHTDE